MFFTLTADTEVEGMFCPECGAECEVMLDSFFHRFLCLECNQLWYMLDDKYYPESALTGRKQESIPASRGFLPTVPPSKDAA